MTCFTRNSLADDTLLFVTLLSVRITPTKHYSLPWQLWNGVKKCLRNVFQRIHNSSVNYKYTKRRTFQKMLNIRCWTIVLGFRHGTVWSSICKKQSKPQAKNEQTCALDQGPERSICSLQPTVFGMDLASYAIWIKNTLRRLKIDCVFLRCEQFQGAVMYFKTPRPRL